MTDATGTSDRGGRPPVTSNLELEQVALALFADRGFAETTVDDIAAEAGISRRTFFRYYASKNDAVWGEFDRLLAGMERRLADSAEGPLLEVVTDAIVAFNDFPAEAVAAHRTRMALVLHTPALQAHSALRYADWRAVIARHAARVLDQPVEGFVPQLVAHVALAAAVTAYEQWLADESADLPGLLTSTFDLTGWSGMVAPSSNTRG